MAFITVEDLVGTVEVLVFPKIYEKNRQAFTEENKVFIRGRASIGDDPVGKLICEEVIRSPISRMSFGFSSKIRHSTRATSTMSWRHSVIPTEKTGSLCI